ncbi:hypothetical protein Pfo_010347, partial [Paulownia fortunei]
LIHLPPDSASICEITQFQPTSSSSSSKLLILAKFPQIMRIHSPLIPFLLIMVILMTVSQLSSCRYIHRLSSKATLQGPTSEFHSQVSSYFSVPAPKESRNEDKSNYTVSHRKTPGGPNPLHN